MEAILARPQCVHEKFSIFRLEFHWMGRRKLWKQSSWQMQHSFSTHERMFLWKCQRFKKQKMSRPDLLYSTPLWKHMLISPKYCQPSNIRCTLIGDKLVDHSDVVVHLSALLQLHLHFWLNTWLQWIGQRKLQDQTRDIWILRFGASYIRDFTVGGKYAGLNSNKFNDADRDIYVIIYIINIETDNGSVLSGKKPLPHLFVTRLITVKPVCNDHICHTIYYLWFIQ